MKPLLPFVFIVGSPRSGTTILGEILDNHPDIAQWYEPYFVWDKYFRSASHDERTAEDATPKIIKQIYNRFVAYQKKIKRPVIIDKSPRNSLKIPFILKIFPDAHFIHILRDGRDVTLSINKEWRKRKSIVAGSGNSQQFNYSRAINVIKRWLNRQPFLYDRFNAFWFETHGHLFNKKKHLNRLRWHGNTGWGPRYKGWENDFKKYSCLEFNALQWLNCVTAIRKNWEMIPEKNKIEIRYEDFISHPQETLLKTLNLTGVKTGQNFFQNIPILKKNNFNKWKTEFSLTEIKQIHPILTPMLEQLKYTQKSPW